MAWLTRWRPARGAPVIPDARHPGIPEWRESITERGKLTGIGPVNAARNEQSNANRNAQRNGPHKRAVNESCTPDVMRPSSIP